MNTRLRFYRVVAGASLGAVLWAACSSPQSRVSNTRPVTPPAPATAPEPTPAKDPERRLGVAALETRDVITQVLKMERESVAETHGVTVSAEFDVKSYRDALIQQTCERLKLD
ncbi:MAG: hypothetical protein JWM68_5048 [Verrucomicrobiales bacterium]|nr:hypothetical protein [Verrucomicrobiales bacterium]